MTLPRLRSRVRAAEIVMCGARIRQEIIAVPEEFESFEAAVAYMSKQNRYATPEVLRRRLQYATKPLPNGKIGWRYDLAIREQWRQGPPTSEDLWPAWRSLSCPTLIVRVMLVGVVAENLARGVSGHCSGTEPEIRSACACERHETGRDQRPQQQRRQH